VSFTVPWVAGKERPRFTHGHTYTPKATRVREREVAGLYKLAALAQHKAVPMAGAGVPVTLSVIMQHPLPKSPPKRVTSEPYVRKPDIDNAIKVALAVLVLISAMLLAGWLDAPEIEEHEQWYAEQSQRTWCL
jgi:Holliday junction resolvase RusA-like endonuclease